MKTYPEIKFQPYSFPREWESVLIDNSFSKEDQQAIKGYWLNYIECLNFDLEKEYEKVRFHQLNKAARISPLWRNWASDGNTKVTIDFDYSSNLECQRNGMKDKQRKITDWEEQGFAAALMCCDTPWKTVSFLFEQFILTHKLGFVNMVKSFAELSKYVQLQFEIIFLGKHELDFPRISDFEVANGIKKTLSLIPHPNHGSLGSGHTGVSQSVKKKLPLMFPDIAISPDWLQLCDDCGVARITAGIHWFIDHEASIDSINEHHDLAEGYLRK